MYVVSTVCSCVIVINHLSIGMDDLDCGPHVLSFKSGSVMASVNISLVNDDVPECDETFKAHIVIDNGGNSTGQGLRLGRQNSTDITVKDEGMWLFIKSSFC